MANERARHLRKNMSEAEWKLWSVLRGKHLQGYRFRRQHPIGPYIVDFVCVAKRLIVEVDGGQHAEPEQQDHDERRTAWLEAKGYQVIRFWTSEVRENRDGVLEAIMAALADRTEGVRRTEGERGEAPPPGAPRT